MKTHEIAMQTRNPMAPVPVTETNDGSCWLGQVDRVVPPLWQLQHDENKSELLLL